MKKKDATKQDIVKMRPGSYKESTRQLAALLAPAVCRMLNDPNAVFLRPLPTSGFRNKASIAG